MSGAATTIRQPSRDGPAPCGYQDETARPAARGPGWRLRPSGQRPPPARGGAAQALTPTEVAGRTFVGKTTVTSVLDAHERRQLVRRYPHPTSRRSVPVKVTEAGGLACEDILRRRHALEARWLADLPEPDRQELLRLLGVAKGLLSRAHVPPRPVDQVPGQGG